MKTKVIQWWPYLTLLLILVVCGSVAWLLPSVSDGLPGVASNLWTEVVGILITVGLIDAVLRRREARQLQRYRSLGLRQLKGPLDRQLHLLFEIYKASVERKPDREISGTSDLFHEDYFEQVAHLDGLADGPFVGGSGRDAIPWFEHIYTETRRFKDDLERVVDRYAMYLDVDTIDTVESIRGSDFIDEVGLGPAIADYARKAGKQHVVLPFLATYTTDVHGQNAGTHTPLREYTNALRRLEDICNKAAPDDKKTGSARFMWHEGVPKTGSARIPDWAIPDWTILHETGEEGGGPDDAGERAEREAT